MSELDEGNSTVPPVEAKTEWERALDTVKAYVEEQGDNLQTRAQIVLEIERRQTGVSGFMASAALQEMIRNGDVEFEYTTYKVRPRVQESD